MRIYELLKEASEEQVRAKMLPANKKLQPVPKFPAVPTKYGNLGNGYTAKINPKTGGAELSGSNGKFVWDKAGKPVQYITPNYNGYYEVHNMATRNAVAHYVNGGLSLEQEYDKNGKAVGLTGGSYQQGDDTMSMDRKGNKTFTRRSGSDEIVAKQSSLKDRWGNPVKSGDGDVVGTTADIRKYRYTDKRTKTEI